MDRLTRQMWKIAWPAIIANITTPLLGLTDTCILGHFPDAIYLAGIALGATIISILYNSLNFLRIGTTGLTSQASGRSAHGEVRCIFYRSLLIAGALALLLAMLQRPMTRFAFSFSDSSEQAEHLAAQYITIRIWGALFALGTQVTVGSLLGLGRAAAVLLVQLVATVANIAFSLSLVYGFGLDIDGVALGTVLAEALGFLLSLALWLRQEGTELPKLAHLLEFTALLDVFRLKRDIFIRSLLLVLVLSSIPLVGSSFGKELLAVNAILFQFQALTSFGLDGFAQAAEVLVGQQIGRRQPLKPVVLLTSRWAVYCAALFTLLYFFFGSSMVDLVTDIKELRALSADYLIWVIVLPLISVWSFQLDGIFMGATQGTAMRNGMLGAALAYALFAAALVPYLGNHGLWLSYAAFLLFRALFLALYYPRISPQGPSACA